MSGPTTPPPPTTQAKPHAPPQGRPHTPEELEAWLEAHHLAHARRESLLVVEPLLPKKFRAPHLVYELGHRPVTAALDGSLDLRRRAQGRAQQAAFEEAAWKWLHAEAERVRKGLERERQRGVGPQLPLTDERLGPWKQVLERERARVREHAVPRLLPGITTVTFMERPLRIALEEPRPRESASEAWGHFRPRVRVLVEPRALLEGSPGVSCWCSPGEAAARCVHALSALDTLLDMIVNPAEAADNAKLAEQLFVIPSRQILGAIEKAAAAVRAREEAPAVRVTFRLEGLEKGQPRIRPYLQRQKRKGGYSRGAQVGWNDEREARAALASPEEVEAFELSRLSARLSPHEAYPLLLRALKVLAHSPRLFVSSRPDAPLRVREAPLGFVFAESEGGFSVCPAIEGTLITPGSLVPPPHGTAGAWLLFERSVPRLTLVSLTPEAQAMRATLGEYGTHLPASARPALLRNLAGLEAAFPVSLPESLEARVVPASPGLLLRLRPVEAESLEGQLLVRPLPEAPPLPPGEGPPEARGVRGGERVVARRDLETERAEALAVCERLGVPTDSPSNPLLLEGVEAALAFLERLEPLSGPELRVEWEESPWKVVNTPDALGLKVEVRRLRDWFGVEGGIEVDGDELDLAVLLDALRRRRRFVPLGPGRWARITEALRERLQPLADLTHAARQGLEVSTAAAPVLEALAEAGAQVHVPPDWRRLARRIREAQAKQFHLPAGLQARLRDYQHEGFVWMARLTEWGGGGCLADDMGLGKTLQTLALLLHRAKKGPALVVAPTSVCFNWTREASRFAPSLRPLSYRESDRERLLAELKPGDMLLVSYGLLVRDAERLAAISFATLVVDEAQAAKNPDTARARALRGLQAEARVALTGTPVENRLSELWSLYSVVYPGLFGSRDAFRERFISPIERHRDAGARAALSRVLRPFLLRRTKAEVARELPPRIETIVPIVLSDGERQLYENARRAALARMKAEESSRFEMLAALTRLRLLACHPRLGDADSPLPSSKLERLLELVEELRAEGSRALIFSQFTRLLGLAREALEARGVMVQYLDGQTPVPERQARVEAFQRGEGEVFLISLKAGGTGLNLTAADHVIHLDPWWNPAVEDQATDRAHRIGQTRTVTVSRLVAEGTVEEAILALHAEKRELAASLLSEADGAAALSPEQLLALLRYTSEQRGGSPS